MTTLTVNELLKEFLIDRTTFDHGIPFARFKKLFPKGISEVAIEGVYNHLRRTDHKNKRKLEKTLDSISNTAKAPLSSLNQIEDVDKIINNLNDLDKIIDLELQRAIGERENEINKLRQFTNNVKEQFLKQDIHDELNELNERFEIDGIYKELGVIKDV